MRVRIDESGALAGLRRVQTAAAECVSRVGHSGAQRMERYAKENRPWTDRTGNARRTLEGRLEQSGDIAAVGIVGHMPYSVYLELSYGQKYAILAPTVHALAPSVIRELADGLARL